MPGFDLRLKLGAAVAVLLLAALVALAALAARLGHRARRADLAIAFALPLLLLAPYLTTLRLFFPTAAFAAANAVGATAEGDLHDLALGDAARRFLEEESALRELLATRQGELPGVPTADRSAVTPMLATRTLSPLDLGARLLPIRNHLLAAFALGLAVAFLGATQLARAFGVKPGWARLAGFAFALGGALAPRAVLASSPVVPWLPWLALALVRLVRRPSRASLLASTGLLALLLVTGDRAEATGGLLLGACLVLGLRRRVERRGVRQAPSLRRRPIAVAPLLLACAAASLLLTGETARSSTVGGHSLPGESTALPAAPEAILAGLFHSAPHLAGGELSADPWSGARPAWSPAATAYAGAAALGGLGLLVLRPLPRRFVPLVASFALSIAAVAWGGPAASPSRGIAAAGLLGASVAAAGGFATLGNARGGRVRALVIAVAFLTTLSAGAAAPGLLTFVLLALANVAALQPRRRAIVLASLALLLDLVPFAWRHLPRGERERFPSAIVAPAAPDRRPPPSMHG